MTNSFDDFYDDSFEILFDNLHYNIFEKKNYLILTDL